MYGEMREMKMKFIIRLVTWWSPIAGVEALAASASAPANHIFESVLFFLLSSLSLLGLTSTSVQSFPTYRFRRPSPRVPV